LGEVFGRRQALNLLAVVLGHDHDPRRRQYKIWTAAVSEYLGETQKKEGEVEREGGGDREGWMSA